jgi:hypothetical protein
MTRAPRIVVSVRADGSTVRYEVRASRPIDRYFSSEKMFVTYDVDLAGVPESILLIPGLATIAPIAWILGAELYTTTIDPLSSNPSSESENRCNISIPRSIGARMCGRPRS